MTTSQASMNETSRIVDQLQRAFDGDAWSGPSLLTTLQGLNATQAATRVLPTAHSIWEIVLHLTAWIETVQQRIQQDKLIEISAAADWPSVPSGADEAAWQQALADLRHAHTHLIDAVNQLTDSDLDRQLGGPRDHEQGGGVSYYIMLHGLVQHNLYHAGQIALLHKSV
ncbi:DinB family protein [Hymenobacter radiodurans]|uniref:DinB family protein n=1 Tax=Hymenobacter radiodurans TaxID=2496028 RepID=UPI001058DF46|nr:DinB family protein [Hymenobacter radiodurans]